MLVFSIVVFTYSHEFSWLAWSLAIAFSLGFARNLKGVASNVNPLLDRLAHVLNHLLRIAKHHHGFIHVEQLVVQASVACSH